ncbi:MAG TPA: Sec-independent protein translocase subunit TatA [Jiangellaceae bacterium]|nr:Sec-independent protein translocase subunit TatA [Jiangellaceae bacterium]
MFGLRPQELLIILLIVVILFGAKKLPQVARGMGQSLRIFKSETRTLSDENDDDQGKADQEVRAIESQRPTQTAEQVEQAPQNQAETSPTSTVRDAHGREV